MSEQFGGNNGNEQAKNLVKGAGRTAANIGKIATKPLANKAKKKTKETAQKAGKKILKYIVSFVKWLGSSISSVSPQLICIILVICMLYGMIAVLFAQANGQIQQVQLTPEGRVIIQMFESYCNETYRLYGGVRGDNRIDNPDDEREKYRNILNFVKQNDYEYELCGIWKVTVREIISEIRYKDNSMRESNAEKYDWSSSEDVYEQFIMFYYTEDVNTENVRIGFESSLYPDEYPGSEFHQYYTNEMFKACLESFINEDGSYIASADELENQESTAETSSNSNNGIISTGYEDRSKELTEIIMDNLYRGLNERISFKQPESYNGDDVKYISEIYKYYAVIDDIIPMDTTPSEAQLNQCKEDYKKKIQNSAAGFLMYAGAGDVANLVRLAKAQIGNGGQKYCDALFGGQLVDWCCIYAGWLLQEGGGVNLSEYGWSAGVGVWVDALTSKGLYYQAHGSYKPKVGDLIFFGNRAHVGVVIEVTDSEVVTSEGNSGVSDAAVYCMGSKVCEHRYSYDDSYIMGYGSIKYKLDHKYSNNLGYYEGAYLKSEAGTDPDYKCLTFEQWAGRKLTDNERAILERTVSGEFGNDDAGAIMIAQCLRDALVYGYCDSVSNLPSKMQYDGYYAYSGTPTETAKYAVRYIFDEGGMGVQHRVLVMYNPTICSSPWHESQRYVVTVGDVRFFDYY